MTNMQIILKAVSIGALVYVGLCGHEAERHALNEARETDELLKGIHAGSCGRLVRYAFLGATVIACCSILQ